MKNSDTQIRVQQLTNNNYNPVANHFIIKDGDTEYLQSYNSIVVKRHKGKITLGADWDYSPTTLKYVKQYLGTSDTVKTMRKDIDYGHYTLDTNL